MTPPTLVSGHILVVVRPTLLSRLDDVVLHARSAVFLRTLEPCYSFNSTFSWFPFCTPGAMEVNLGKLNLASDYDFGRPAVSPPVKTVTTYNEVSAVFKDSFSFRSPYVDSAGSLIQGRG